MSDAATPNNSNIPNGNAKQSGDTAPTNAAVLQQLPLNALQAVMMGGGPFPQENTAQPQQQYPLRVTREWEFPPPISSTNGAAIAPWLDNVAAP